MEVHGTHVNQIVIENKRNYKITLYVAFWFYFQSYWDTMWVLKCYLPYTKHIFFLIQLIADF